MQILDEAPVLESEIDSLGHMNVRYYLGRVDRANVALLQNLGIDAAALQPGTLLRRFDTYSRFRREQFAGAHLQVAGGVLELNREFARCYFEIRNPARGEIAATFITQTTLIDSITQSRLPFAPQLLRINEKYGVQLPEHGTPRSLSLDQPRLDVTLDEIAQRVSEHPAEGMMSGRRESTIEREDCDERGRLREDLDLMFIMHRDQPGVKRETYGPPVMKTSDGHRFSWAMIETRAIVLGRPVAGDCLVSIGADVAFGERWRQSRRWAFVKDSGLLVGINDTIGIALDLDERRSIAIPDQVANSIQESYLPDLA